MWEEIQFILWEARWRRPGSVEHSLRLAHIKAAIHIQSVWRRNRGRLAFETAVIRASVRAQKKAATHIQSVWRRYVGRLASEAAIIRANVAAWREGMIEEMRSVSNDSYQSSTASSSSSSMRSNDAVFNVQNYPVFSQATVELAEGSSTEEWPSEVEDSYDDEDEHE